MNKILRWLVLAPAWFLVVTIGVLVVLPDATLLGQILGLYALGATSATFSLVLAGESNVRRD